MRQRPPLSWFRHMPSAARLVAGALVLALVLTAQWAHVPAAHTADGHDHAVELSAADGPGNECEHSAQPECTGTSCGACVAFVTLQPFAAITGSPGFFISVPRLLLATPERRFRPPILHA